MGDVAPRQFSFRAMGGPCALSLYAEDSVARQVAVTLEAEVRRLEAKYSRFQTDSDLSRLNRTPDQWQEVDAETAGLLDFAHQCFIESDGLFDITTGVLREAWDFKSGQLPAQAQLEALRPRVGWSQVGWSGGQVKIPAGMELDLGGLVKEFAADRLLTLLSEARVSGLVNLAGDIRVTGPRPDGSPWPVGISHPRQTGRAAATLPLIEGGLATSGDYERFMMVGGRRYCHILHPKTGWPLLDGPSSVTVVADNCLLAGALTTIAMLKGKEAESWLAGLGVPFLLFDDSLTVSGTLVPSHSERCPG